MPGPVRRRLAILSPFAVLLIGHGVARGAAPFVGVWAFVPLALVYWGVIALLVLVLGDGRPQVRAWLARPRGAVGWSALALLVALIPLPVLVQHWPLLGSGIWLPWLAFALLNPWFEEGYWRGLLLDATEGWPAWAGVLWASTWFAASHPVMWGVESIANRDPVVLISTFVMGVVWSVAYRKTWSLVAPIAAHVLVDLFNLSVPVFLNLHVPPPLF